MENKKNIGCDCNIVHNEVVNQVRQQMSDPNDFYNLANLYKMFSDNTRLKVLWALSCAQMCVCDLSLLLNMTKSAISHQLKSLRLSNLVKYEKRGKEVYYSLADDHVYDIFRIGLEHIKEGNKTN